MSLTKLKYSAYHHCHWTRMQYFSRDPAYQKICSKFGTFSRSIAKMKTNGVIVLEKQVAVWTGTDKLAGRWALHR